MMNIGFTGHRTFGEVENYTQIITNVFNKYILKVEGVKLHLGGAYGFDNIVALEAIKQSIPFTLHLPYEDLERQTKKWTKEQKKELDYIISHASNVITYNGYFERNRGIVDNSELLIAYLSPYVEASGTEYTVKYSNKKNIQCINIF